MLLIHIWLNITLELLALIPSLPHKKYLDGHRARNHNVYFSNFSLTVLVTFVARIFLLLARFKIYIFLPEQVTLLYRFRPCLPRVLWGTCYINKLNINSRSVNKIGILDLQKVCGRLSFNLQTPDT